MLPKIDGRRFRLPDGRLFDVWQTHQGAVFRTEGYVIVGLGKYRGLAGNGISQNAKTAARTDDKRIKPVQIFQGALQGVP